MKNLRITLIAATLLAGGAGLTLYHQAAAEQGPKYRLATATRGDVQATISATGALGAVTTVQVGTQVSGQVSAIHVDFNDRVRKGQLLARIDPTLAQQSVRDAEAGMERVQALLTLSQQEYDRNKQLFEREVLTAAEFGTTESDYSVAKANFKSAQVALDKARQNLAYTSIYAPIDGVIVERNVDVGQTVAASLSAPQLFLIANNLSRMQILASVDESDIGMIKEGQQAHFTVQSYPNERFTGTVKQVRLQSMTLNNVVNYTAVLEVENHDGKLLPGMTATVQFLTGSQSDVVLVPNAALRFTPTAEMVSRAGAAGVPSAGVPRSGRSDAATPRMVGAGTQGAAQTGQQRSGTLWYIGADGRAAEAKVLIGLSDGRMTGVQSPALDAGTQVILGLTSGSAQSATSGARTNNPLQPQSAPRGPGGF